MLPSLMTRSGLARRLVVLPILLFPILLPIQCLAEPAFELPDGLVLFDETVPIVLFGLDPGRIVTIRLEQHDSAGLWRSLGIFVSDAEGRVDVSRSAPLAGTYSGVAPMGLIWSVERDPTVEPRPAVPEPDLTPVVSRLSAEIDGETVATGTLTRHPVVPDVEVTEVRDAGLVGVYYRPAGAGPFPSMLVMGGSGGGVLPPVQYPGGLASRGYAVLALAYFGIEGRPAQLQMLPIEYFKSGLDWLAARSEVDGERIGVFGSSRGGELVLLLGATYPEIAAVVAHVPSHVVWEGCCDAVAVGEPAWTYRGSVLPHLQTPVPADRMVFPDDLIFPPGRCGRGGARGDPGRAYQRGGVARFRAGRHRLGLELHGRPGGRAIAPPRFPAPRDPLVVRGRRPRDRQAPLSHVPGVRRHVERERTGTRGPLGADARVPGRESR